MEKPIFTTMRNFIFGRAQSIHIQFMRYFFVGGTAAVVDLLAFAILIKYAGMSYLLAAFFAYMMGLAWNYIISIIWVFESKHPRHWEMLMIFLIALGGLFWTEIILYVSIEHIGIDALISKMISQVIVLFWNFGMRKFYVFH